MGFHVGFLAESRKIQQKPHQTVDNFSRPPSAFLRNHVCADVSGPRRTPNVSWVETKHDEAKEADEERARAAERSGGEWRGAVGVRVWWSQGIGTKRNKPDEPQSLDGSIQVRKTSWSWA